ncbi:hypothetical protein [Haladaptatus sp. NG-SE-30]
MATNTTTSVGSAPTGDAKSLLVRRTETVAPEGQVHHFDELSDEFQQVLVEFDGEKSVVPITQQLADEVTADTTVVFTDYYRVEVV